MPSRTAQPSPSQSPESIEAAILAAAAATFSDRRGGVTYVMDSLVDAPPQSAVTQGPSLSLGRPLTQQARTAISAAFNNGPEVRFIHDPTTVVDESAGISGCHAYRGTLLTFSVPAKQPDGTYQVALFESSGCSGSSHLLDVVVNDGHFQVTRSVWSSSWIV